MKIIPSGEESHTAHDCRSNGDAGALPSCRESNNLMNPQCFVIMPIGNPSEDPERADMFDQIYSKWIKPTVESITLPGNESFHMECHRADKSNQPGDIIKHIIDQLVNADVVIADLTDKNPNVFYELGARHAVNNNTILVAQNIKAVPADLRNLRTIEYQYNPKQMLLFQESLANAVLTVLANHNTIDNPVRQYLYEKAMHDLVSQAAPLGFNALKQMVAELVNLRKDLETYARQARVLMELIPSGSGPMSTDRDVSIWKPFEGIWKSSTGGTYCARAVNGRLYIPYSYRGVHNLVGHYYDCTVLGQTLVGRFEWFEQDINGYAYFRLAFPDRLEGGWWFAENVPHDLKQELGRLNESLPARTPASWKKQVASSRFPKWAEDYFQKKLYERHPPSHRKGKGSREGVRKGSVLAL